MSKNSKKKSISSDPFQWGVKILRQLSLEDKIGQMIMPAIQASDFKQYTIKSKQNFYQSTNIQFGGFIIFEGEAYESAILIKNLQTNSKIPLLIGSDFERGANFRIHGTTTLPWNMAIGATQSEQWAYKQGKITAQQAQALGVNWIFAPVVDVNNNPANPVINIRSFGEDPELVSKLGVAFVKGAQAVGVLTTAKHFPGHGDTKIDSHLDLPTIRVSRHRLEKVELAPFKQVIAAGVKTVMTAHLSVPVLDKKPNRPATLSASILEKLLRKQLQFKGLIVSDSMKMEGLTRNYWSGEAAIQAVLAGVDILLDPPNPYVVFQAIFEAVSQGRILKSRINASVKRIFKAKAWLGLNQSRRTNFLSLVEKANTTKIRKEAQEMAEAAVTIVRDSSSKLPLDSRIISSVHLIVVTKNHQFQRATELETQLLARIESVQVDQLCSSESSSNLFQVKPSTKQVDLTIVALFTPLITGTGKINFSSKLSNQIRKLIQDKPNLIIVSLGNPYLLSHFPLASSYLCTYSNAEASQIAAVKALFGEIPVEGKLPVSLPGIANRTTGLKRKPLNMTLRKVRSELNSSENKVTQLKKKLALFINNAIQFQTFPGASLAIGFHGNLIIERGYGKLTYDKKSPSVKRETIYDLASLTKVISTTTLVMQAYESGKLSLDLPIYHFFLDFPVQNKHSITINHLLTHSSGLPSYFPFYKKIQGKENILRKLLSIQPQYQPGCKSLYSDLGFILLGSILEKLNGETLDHMANQRIFEPLEMYQTMFRPKPDLRSRIAPTEKDPWRKRLLRGEVHDENAYALGGIAAHAGLFGTAGDLAIFCQTMLNGGVYNHHRILKKATIKTFTQRQKLPRSSTRALGWDTPSRESSAGQWLSKGSFGHTGFTGTSLWIDPIRHIFIVLLTNRVHPTRQNNAIQQFRRAVSNMIVETIDHW